VTPEGRPVDWDTYNREFYYSASPASYFMARWNLLMLSAAEPDAVGALLVAGIEYDGITAKIEDRPQTEADERQHLAFLITESQSLLHHISESLIRLFLAHAGQPVSPWLEMASLNPFWKFKAQVALLTHSHWPDGLEDEVLPVFLGRPRKDQTAQVLEAKTASIRLIRILSEHLLKDAPLYNSVKHGLTVVAGHAGFSVISEQTGQGFGSSGTAVAFLEREKCPGGHTWKHTRQLVSIRRTLWLSHLAITQIEALWTIAMWPYSDIQPEGVTVVTNDGIDTAMIGEFSDANAITRFSHFIGFEAHWPKGEPTSQP